MSYRIQQLRYQLREDPSSRAFLRLAGLLREAGESGEAAEVLRRGLEHHPRFAAAWLALGRALADGGDGAGAEEAFRRVLAIQPVHPEAALAVAGAAMERGDWEAAADLVEPLGELEDAALAARRADLASRIAGEQRRVAAEEEARRAAAEEAARLREERRARPPVHVAGAVEGVDPFADLTGVGIAADTVVQDVFATGEEPSVDAAAVAVEPLAEEPVEAVEEAEPESWADVAEEVAAVPEPEAPLTEEDEVAQEPTAAEPPEVEEPEPAELPELEELPAPADDGGPLPTLTLARLAAQQGAHDLAVTTLERLLAREPGNLEAAELLALLRSGGSVRAQRATSAAKIAALRAWLDTIRLASERHSP